MFKKSGKKMLKAFKLLPLAKQPWKFPTSSCWDGLQTSLGNFHRQNDPKEYFFTAFFAQRKMTMEISNVVLGKSSYHHHVSKS